MQYVRSKSQIQMESTTRFLQFESQEKSLHLLVHQYSVVLTSSCRKDLFTLDKIVVCLVFFPMYGKLFCGLFDNLDFLSEECQWGLFVDQLQIIAIGLSSKQRVGRRQRGMQNRIEISSLHDASTLTLMAETICLAFFRIRRSTAK